MSSTSLLGKLKQLGLRDWTRDRAIASLVLTRVLPYWFPATIPFILYHDATFVYDNHAELIAVISATGALLADRSSKEWDALLGGWREYKRNPTNLRSLFTAKFELSKHFLRDLSGFVARKVSGPTADKTAAGGHFSGGNFGGHSVQAGRIFSAGISIIAAVLVVLVIVIIVACAFAVFLPAVDAGVSAAEFRAHRGEQRLSCPPRF